MSWRRAHPLYILTRLRRFLWLLILPLTRGFIIALEGGGAKAFIKDSAADLFILAAIAAFSAAEWYMYTYRVVGDTVECRTGVLRRKAVRLPSVFSYRVDEPALYRLFGAARLSADTLGGHHKKPDFSVIAKREDALKIVGGSCCGGRPEMRKIALMALVASNSVAGLAIIIASVRGSGRILSAEVRGQILGRFKEAAELLTFGIPPAAAAVGYFILLSWVLGFMLNCARFWGFCADVSGGSLMIKTGLFSRTGIRVATRSICRLDIRRGILGLLLNVSTVLVSAPGMGRKPGILLPAGKKTETLKLIRESLPELLPSESALRPSKGNLIRYCSDPLSQMLIIIAAAFAIGFISPELRRIIVYLAAMAELVPIWGLAIRCAELKTAGISRDSGSFTLRCSSYFYLHTVVVNNNCIVCAKIVQSPVQRLTKSCDIIIKTGLERHFTAYRLRGYNISQAESFFAPERED